MAIEHFSLKKRKYLWTTSMDAELTFIMANQGLVLPGNFFPEKNCVIISS